MRVAWRVLRTEGLLAVRDRALDRLAEARRRRSFSPAPPGWRPEPPVPVLTLSSTPPAPWLGGVQSHLLRSLKAAPAGSALLYPQRYGWRLEVAGKALAFPGAPPSSVTLEDAAFEEAVRSAVGVLGARAVHVEGLADLPPGSLLRLRREGLDVSIALHDFAAYCPRPHLLEHPQLRFCWYSRDLARCGHCLRQDWPVENAFQAERRAVSAELLASASALVFPSEFLRQTYAELFPGLSPERQRIVAPTGGIAPLPPRSSGPVRHVALVGGVKAHKGALVFEEVVRRRAGEELRWTTYGGGDPKLLQRLGRLPRVRIRGYYRSGTFARLLRRDAVDLALLLSIVPESYSLSLDECAAAGVPVVAFDLGAVGERLPLLGAGRLVPLEEGAEGIAAAILEISRGIEENGRIGT
ncbi:MAG TPA: glycosyltransferase [Thermoanaerobaculia bacterium]|nr:glycosyltransferase [Thermoanaerobaculia bacterium]